MNNLKVFHIFLCAVLLFTGCVGMQPQPEDPSKEPNLAKYPIGVHVQKIGVDNYGQTHVDITVRNNSGKFINQLFVKVYPYDNEIRVGDTINNFSSINIGETMIARQQINTSRRPWNRWRSSFEIY